MHALIAGVDEVGRGPLAGDVVAAAVILDPDKPIEGLQDSKVLSEKKREHLFNVISERALSYSIASASVIEIDQMNILQASLLAMKRAVATLNVQPTRVLVDGHCLPDWTYDAEAIIKGDQREDCIAAASILAKVTRDREMLALSKCFPGYGFERNKGYPTAAHLAALKSLGVTPLHRKSFAPVRRIKTRQICSQSDLI